MNCLLSIIYLFFPAVIKRRNDTGIKVEVVSGVDVNDPQTVIAVAKSTNVLINCVGPFRYYGEVVVKACIENKTHYVDITGEPEFIDRMYVKYNELAKKNDVMVVPASGFDSVPADIGVLYSKKKLVETGVVPTTVEMFLQIQNDTKEGLTFHYATYESAVQGFGSVDELRKLRKQIKRKPAQSLASNKLKIATRPQWDSRVSRWILPFPGADASVVRMGQQITEEYKDKPSPPVSFAAYLTVKSIGAVIGLVGMVTIFSIFAKFKLGRKILLAFPRLFTFGLFTHAGPTESQLQNTSFVETFIARGVTAKDTKVLELAKQGKSEEAKSAIAGRKEDYEMIVQVMGPEPGYVATPICIVAAATTILCERKAGKWPNGILTPASAFYKSDFIKTLQQSGIEIRIMHRGEKK